MLGPRDKPRQNSAKQTDKDQKHKNPANKDKELSNNTRSCTAAN